MPPLKALIPRMFPSSWFSTTPKRKRESKKGFSSLGELTLPSRKESRAPEWFDMEQGVKGFETSVVSPPRDDRLQPGWNKALEAMRIPSPVRAQQPVIHKQQDISVDYGRRQGDDDIPRAL